MRTAKKGGWERGNKWNGRNGEVGLKMADEGVLTRTSCIAKDLAAKKEVDGNEE